MTLGEGTAMRDRAEAGSASRRAFISALGAVGAAALLPAGGLLAQTAQPAKPRLIDVHHHFYPPEFMKAMAAWSQAHRAGSTARPIQEWTPARAVEEMDKNGMTTAILSLASIPDAWLGADAATMNRYSRICNDYGAQMVRDHPGRFGLFASLPLPNVDGALKEIEYALDTLQADGIGLNTNFGAKWPGDPEFAPVFEELNRRKAIVYFHPTAPNCCLGNMVRGITESTLEVPYDTGRAVFSLLVGGTLSRFQDIKWIFSHGGGPVPIMAGRVDALARLNPAMQKAAPNGVDYELKRLYYDTANAFHPPTFAALIKYVPVSQIMFGTDYPYLSVGQNAEGLTKLGLSRPQLAAIRSGNATRMFARFAAVKKMPMPMGMPSAKKT